MPRDERGGWRDQGEYPRGPRRGWGRPRGGGRGRHPYADTRYVSAPASSEYGPPPDRHHMRQVDATRQIHQSLFQFGEAEGVDISIELPKVCAWLESQAVEFPAAVLSAVRILATEQPHKTALTAALIGHLALAPSQAPTESSPSLGQRMVDHLVQLFVHDMEAHYWRNVRLTLHVLAALVPLGIVSPASVRRVLQALVDVLSSEGVARDVADPAADCVIEVVCRAGADLLQPEPLPAENAAPSAKEQLDAVVDGVVAYAERRGAASSLLSPFDLDGIEHDFLAEEGFLDRVHALQTMQERGYVRPACLPAASDLLPTTVSPVTSAVPPELRVLALPDLHVAPLRDAARDTQDDDLLAPPAHLNTGKGMVEVVRARIGAPPLDRAPRWFGASVPALATATSVVLRSMVLDVLDLYVINRKECAHVLWTLPHWLRRGTFDGRTPPTRGLFGEADQSWHEAGDGPWSLEDLVLESALSSMLVLPTAPQLELYYASLLREVVTLAPQQVAPSIGRTIRRFYAAAGEGRVHAEVLRRIADWFSVHLSNFNFTWAWSEWQDDAARPWPHPRRALARRIVELEVRLAYYDRIRGTVPPELEASVLPPTEPAPVYAYGDPGHAHHALATQLFQSIKAKASVQVVQADLQSYQQSILAPATDVPDTEDEALAETPADAERIVRDLAVQTLLNAGSRSFSHLLNVMERYHELLRSLSQTPDARLSILASTALFWTQSPQWVLIVCDKLLQYRIVEPVDVVRFVFTSETGRTNAPFALADQSPEWGPTRRDWSSFNWWALLRLTVDKVLGRVTQLTRRVDDLRRQADAADGAPPASGAADEVQVHLDAVLLEQRKVLVTVVSQLVHQMQMHPVPTLDDNTDSAGWQGWWLREWYRAFVVLYHDVLAANRETIMANVFASSAADDPCLAIFDHACALANST
ncbi:Similar to S.cerevisiae protein STO1 (Large subunit of the nuclear mRNA cap-binding protein complex) [Malassezia sympodialis ATCC 42132]|uniref:Similar to S.cerevisiae protein STO1 (Large subunit of the nuclear mRNA cap-binding protein complex) n=1 Tax=Malassezia sympodialis (strain ATCC 42132) TaxID=1230383 RepID=A0A1M8A831_MALS4|nr:Similar to S.cerevisiae protein STO1 (Large subunit of the nuclear mRNA cap-binding protein complex) [Malassezia sympodialis ATCC 42132]